MITPDQRQQLHRRMVSMLEDPQEAEDVVQEALLRLHRNQANLREQDALLGWLYTTATNLALDRLRQRKRSRVVLGLDPGETDGTNGESAGGCAGGAEVERAVERREMSDCVRRYLDVLPDDQRIALLLYEDGNMKVREIADLLEISQATAKIRIHRARRRLQELLQQGCDFSHNEENVLLCEPTGSANEGQLS